MLGFVVGLLEGLVAKTINMNRVADFEKELLHGADEGLEVGKLVGVCVEGLELGAELGLEVGIALGTSVVGEVDGRLVEGELEGPTQ